MDLYGRNKDEADSALKGCSGQGRQQRQSPLRRRFNRSAMTGCRVEQRKTLFVKEERPGK
jgi:hypothetical protein